MIHHTKDRPSQPPSLLRICSRVQKNLTHLRSIVFIFFIAYPAGAQMIVLDSVAFALHQKDHIFSMEAPDYLVETFDLWPGAALQLGNDFNATYLMILQEEKSLGLHANLEQLVRHFNNHLADQGGLAITAKDTTIGCFSAHQAIAELTVEGQRLVYLTTFVETDNSFFKIFAWTLASQQAYLNNFRQAVGTFRPLPPRPGNYIEGCASEKKAMDERN